MTTPLTDAELAEMRERCEAATPGPWEPGIFDPELDPVELYRQSLAFGSGDVWLVWAPNHPLTRGEHPRPEHAVTVAITGNGPTSEANAEFLIHAREDMPRLLAENARLRALLQTALDQAHEMINTVYVVGVEDGRVAERREAQP